MTHDPSCQELHKWPSRWVPDQEPGHGVHDQGSTGCAIWRQAGETVAFRRCGELTFEASVGEFVCQMKFEANWLNGQVGQY